MLRNLLGGTLTVTKCHGGRGEGVRKWPELCYVITEWHLRCNIEKSAKNSAWIARFVYVTAFLYMSNFRFLPSVDGNWGGLIDPVKNTFNGMIGMLQRNVRLLI